MIKLLFIYFSFFCCHCFAQKKPLFHSWHFSASNNHSALPFHSFSRLAYKDLNPGFSFGPNKSIFHSKNTVLGLRVHYFNLQKVQHSISISAELGYSLTLPAGFFITPNIGIGVMQAFSPGKVFKLNDEGEYVTKRNFGRTQVLLFINERLEKQITNKGKRAFLSYQQSLQAPFINEYVPLLPFNSLSVGLSIPIF
jgi:hypothetical protein